MKKLWFVVLFTFAVSIGINAQDDKDKVKKTSTIPQKVHNTVSKNNKYKGYKSKRKRHGVTRKHKVNHQTGEVKNKTDK